MNTKNLSVRLSVFATVGAFLSLMLLPLDAEARRMGGGGSFGRSAPTYSTPNSPSGAAAPQRSAPSQGQQATNQSGAAAGGAAAGQRRGFMGPLGGLAAGLGLAALFGYLGFGAGMAQFLGTMLIIGLMVFAVIFLVRMLRGQGQQARRPQPAYNAGSGSNSYRQSPPTQAYMPPPAGEPVPGMGRSDNQFGNVGTFGNSGAFDAQPVHTGPVKDLPAGFDEAGFVNSAKKFFITMQGVYDKGDINALREYCTDDVVDHLAQEINARNGAENLTDVVTLEAELIGFELDVDEQIATVAFKAHLREEIGAVPIEVNEMWIMTRPVSGGGWVLAGIHNL